MTRLLPAHLVAAAAAAGLALSDGVRAGPLTAVAVTALLASLVLLVPLPLPGALAVGVVILAGAAWWWGSARLEQLDRSPLGAHVDEAGWFVLDVASEPRVGRFDQRLFAHVRRFRGRPLDERVELRLPLGRAPPQGARVRALAVVREPRRGNGDPGSFDERTWLRRQGMHVVLHVDEWSVVGRRGGLAAVGDRLRVWLRHGSALGLVGERRAVVEGIVLGDDAGLTPSLKTAFRRSGLYHLLTSDQSSMIRSAMRSG